MRLVQWKLQNTAGNSKSEKYTVFMHSKTELNTSIFTKLKYRFDAIPTIFIAGSLIEIDKLNLKYILK